MNHQKGFANIVMVLAIVILVGVAGYFVFVNKSEPVAQQTPTPTQTQKPTLPTPTPTPNPTANWKTYTNTEYGLELKYPPTWNVQEKVTGFGFWINPPNFKMPSSGTVNPYFSFDVTAHMYLGDEKPVIKKFGTQTGYVYAKDQSVYFSGPNGAGGYFIKLYTPPGVDEPNQILSTFRFTKPVPTTTTSDYPAWIKNIIVEVESYPAFNPRVSLTQYQYRNQIVYYLPTTHCCDFTSSLYNERGEFICAPDGGIAGGGDGKCSDFFTTRQNAKVIWTDPR